MSSINQANQLKFYNTEINTQLTEWESYLSKQMRILISEKELFIGRLWSVSEKSGLVNIRFRKDEVPRLNTPYFLGVVGDVPDKNPKDWIFTYKQFRETPKKYWHDKKGSEVIALKYDRAEDNWAFLNVSVSDLNLHEYLKQECLEAGVQPLVIIAENDPPLNYLFNLKEFIETSSDNQILQSDVSLKEDNWKPKGLDNEEDVSDQILKIIDQDKISAIQGPPGTGKSYYAAKISQRLLEQDKSVAVCALTNKALIELSVQPPLEKSLKAGKVFKTNLSKDELVRQPTLQIADNFAPAQGNLLLTTYYKLSNHVKELAFSHKRYDLLIIEEASQAFLATIAMFTEIADKVLIIGDHKQLPPVVITNKKILSKIDPNIDGVINGLETYILNNEERSYRFTKTRRLTKEASELTGLFYDKQLSSISPLNGNVSHCPDIKNIFHKNGGITTARLAKTGTNSIPEKVILDGLTQIASMILNYRKEDTVAIISSSVNLEKRITSSMSKYKPDYSRITVSTVHKAQGLTTDYAIYYMPLANANFEMNLNLFNVATSRARKGTLIVSYTHVSMLVGMTSEVLQFLKETVNVTTNIFDFFCKR